MSYPIKVFWDTVAILNLELKISILQKSGKLWAGNYPRNLIWCFLDGISYETKFNPDEDIQHPPVFVSM